MLCVEYWFDGWLEESARVTYLLVDEVWHRVSFNGRVLHWRTAHGPPEARSAHSGSANKVVDIGERHSIVGSTITAWSHKPSTSGGRLELHFEGLGRLTLNADNDRTSVAFAAEG